MTYPMSDQWRCYGEARRRKILEDDENAGGTSFRINKTCRVDKYFALSERVMRQFRVLCEHQLEPAYIMGHRLVSFLETALPQHPDYHRITLAIQRLKCQSDLEWMRDKMEEIALRIDEEQLNEYMDRQFEPDAASESSSDDDEQQQQQQQQGSWESFTGWGFPDSNKYVPAMVESDTSSCDWTKETSSESEPENETPEFHFDIDEGVFPDPDLQVKALQDDDTSGHSEESSVHCGLNEPVLASPFLKKIANEDVRYETDSEAMDSWAQQDDDSTAMSASSGSALTCDPARIAFRELMNKLPRRKNTSPKDSPASSPQRKLVQHMLQIEKYVFQHRQVEDYSTQEL